MKNNEEWNGLEENFYALLATIKNKNLTSSDALKYFKVTTKKPGQRRRKRSCKHSIKNF